MRKFPLVSQSIIRNRLLNIINSLSNHSVRRDEFSKTLGRLVKTTKNFLKNNKNLILTRADKGNVTVALDKNKYVNEIENILGDSDTYTFVERDPVKKLSSWLRET